MADTYNSWGNTISIQDGNGQEITSEEHIANLNPFRYRGYYFDSETGLYYLQNRYYDPQTYRFVNADTTDILAAKGDLYDKNLFAYCDNNPVARVDYGGEFWDTVLDVISLAISVSDVINNPTSGAAWAGLAADVVCTVVPGLTGGGIAVKTVTKADDAVDVVKAVSKADDVVDTAKTVKATKKTAKIHGNSLKSSKTNYGYALVDKNNYIMKFGETVNPKRRYTQKYLNKNGYTMKILAVGNKTDIHFWQYDMNNYYFRRYNQYPPLIKSRRGW